MPEPAENEVDIALMEQLGRDDSEALRQLVDRHHKSLLNFFYRLGVHMDSEDLVQETFLRLYKSRKRYVAKAKFTTYLFRIAKTVWIDRYRKVSRQQELKEKVEQAHVDLEAPPRRENWMDIREAVGRLPEKLRLVIVMSIFQGMKYAEIAEILEIPVGTVKSRMSLAMQALKEDLV